MQNLAEQTAELSQLDWFVGEWKIQSRMLINPETEQWVDDTCTSTITKVVAGHGLLETFDGTINGDAFNGISLRTYNKTLGKWEQRWLDNSTPGFLAYTGEWDGERFTGYSNVSFKSPEEGGRDVKIGMREVFYDIQDNQFSWKLERSRDGGETWRVIWTLEYTRVK